MGFLDRYFERIGYGGPAAVDLHTLRELHLLHLQQIPYENLDVFCHQGVRLDPETLTRKILLRRRGGYCFVQNGLFAAAARATRRGAERRRDDIVATALCGPDAAERERIIGA